jgi:uncharacterized protein
VQPDLQVIANQNDVTHTLRARLLALTVTDEAGIRADTLELQLDDRDSEISWPAHGAELEVALGYRHTGLVAMGLYVIDEVAHTMPPATLIIRAKAANMRASIKAPQTRSWESLTLGTLIATVASKHQLVAKVNDELAAINITHLDQTAESDLHLLTRLARTYGAIAKPMGRYLVFVPQGQARTATQHVLATVTISVTDIISYHMAQTERSKYKTLSSHWHDHATAEIATITVGNGEPIYTLRHPYNNESEARHAAYAKLAALQRGTATLSLTLVGNPKLQAEGKLAIIGVREPIAGDWLVAHVRHQFDSSGFTSHVEATVPRGY